MAGSPVHDAVGLSGYTLARGTVTADGNGTGVDITALEGYGALLVDVDAVSGTTPTLDGHLEDSADNSSFAVLPVGVAMTQAATTDGLQVLPVNIAALRTYVRWVDDVGGTTPNYVRTVILVGQKKSR